MARGGADGPPAGVHPADPASSSRTMRQLARSPIVAAGGRPSVRAPERFLAMASDLRLGTPAQPGWPFLFHPPSALSGADMGACAPCCPGSSVRGAPRSFFYNWPLPGGRGRADRWGFLQSPRATRSASGGGDGSRESRFATGPTFAHAMTKKTASSRVGPMGSRRKAIEAEAQAQAICMQDVRIFARAPTAPSPPKGKNPSSEGN